MSEEIITKKSGSVFIQSLKDQPEMEYRVTDGVSCTVLIFGSGELVTSGKTVIHIDSENASVRVLGLFSLTGKSNVRIETYQHHTARMTKSNLLVKAVLRDESHFVCQGAIRVEKEAQKTDAYQRNENLLLSDASSAESQPSLEILANDVRCTHGATISAIDPDQLFFLKSRGIPEEAAIQTIASGFLEGAIQSIDQELKLQTNKEDVWLHIRKLFP